MKEAGSWTHKLLEALTVHWEDAGWLTVNLEGPFGTPLGNPEKYDAVVTVSTGTGVVPMISMLHERALELQSIQASEGYAGTRRAHTERETAVVQQHLHEWDDTPAVPWTILMAVQNMQLRYRLRKVKVCHIPVTRIHVLYVSENSSCHHTNGLVATLSLLPPTRTSAHSHTCARTHTWPQISHANMHMRMHTNTNILVYNLHSCSNMGAVAYTSKSFTKSAGIGGSS